MKPLLIVKVHYTKLSHLEGNPRQIVDKNAIGKLRTLIKLHGFRGLLDVFQHKDGKFEILCGNHRFEAGCLEGMTEFNCQVYDGNRKQALARAISDNKSNEWTEWNIPGLKDMFTEIDDGSTNMEMTGFEPDEIKALWDDDVQDGLTDPDSVPDEPKKPKTKTGDLYQLGEHRLLCGDATKKEDVDRLMDGNKADMVFTDPPYSVNYTKKAKEIFNSKNYVEIKNDDMSVAEISEKIWTPAFENKYDVSKDCCVFYVTMPQGGDQMMMMMMNVKWQVKHELIWVKENPVFSMGRLDYDYKHEPIMYGWKAKHKFYGNGKFITSVWEIPRLENKLHPTMKPIALIENAILNSTKKEMLVIDFFSGSGSTLIACEQTSRKCFGMEIDPIYCDVIIKRWEDFTGKKGKLIADKKG